MNITGEKIGRLIEFYGQEKGYEKKSHLPKFCEDFNLNYTQWNAYTRGAQNVGTKIIDLLIDIFPDLNLNWLLKDEINMFVGKESPQFQFLQEPKEKYSKKIGNEDIYNKLDEMLIEIKKYTSKGE